MSSLFSMFDPKLLFSAPLGWVSAALGGLLIPSVYWVSYNQMVIFWVKLLAFVKGEFLAILGGASSPGSGWPTLALFTLILTTNFLGLLPYVFPVSSHLTFSLALAFPLWFGHMVCSWLAQPNFMFAHLVPLGTPPVLMPFMVLIEIISSVIRPITLSVRLAANIIAGHLLLTLLGAQGEQAGAILCLSVILALMTLNVLESAVAMIQAYVFSVLSTLYLSEVQSKKVFKS